MSEHIPAWKRIGLKVKEELENDPLSLATHLDTGNLSKKQQKKITKRVRTDEQKDTTDKKPPKRQKLPKGERAPPPEKDQLVYLKTYTTEKENWKFSKQKQNWILKHVKVIDQDYEEYLVNYFAGLQGGGKDRMAGILRDVIESWNRLQETSSEEKKEETKEETKEGTKEVPKEKSKPKKKDLHDELTRVDADYAIRAKKILKAMTGEEPMLKGIDDVEKTEKEEEKGKGDAKKEDNNVFGSAPTDSDDSDSDSSVTSSESESESDSSKSPSKSESDESITSAPSETSSKKPKEQNTLNNLIIEQVEVSDFVSEADFKDKPASETQEPSQQQSFPQSGNSKKENKLKRGKSKKSKKAQ